MRKKLSWIFKDFLFILSMFVIALFMFPGCGTFVSHAQSGNISNVILDITPMDISVSDLHLSCRIEEASLMSMLPAELEVVFSDGSRGTVPVSWVTAEDYSRENVYFYLYDPVFDGYEVASDVEIPYVVVWIDGLSDNTPYMSIDGACGNGMVTEADACMELILSEGESGDEEVHLQDLIRDVEVDPAANESEIYEYLTHELGLNEAAAVGVLTNINAESGYRQNALGDRNSAGIYTSYGLCQWHNSRWENLINFGIANDVDWQTVHGQMMYLQYELEHGYRSVLNALRAVENTAQGAYTAGYIFCARFEVPANTEQTADARGRVARDRFWPRFCGSIVLDQSDITIYVGDKVQLTATTDPEKEVQWYVDSDVYEEETATYDRFVPAATQDIIYLSSSGEVIGLKPGNVRIVASIGTNEAYCNVEVKESPRDREMLEEGILFRMYNPNSGEHFWTGSLEERNNLLVAGWNYEGSGWMAPKTYGDPVYRLYNENAGDHHYTLDEEEKDHLVSLGWRYEGVAWSSESAEEGRPLYRLFNPNAEPEGKAGAHFWTMSEEERDNLIDAGWEYEGIGWYGI